MSTVPPYDQNHAVPPTSATAPTRNTAGLISLILGVVLLVWQFVLLFVQAMTIVSGGTTTIGVVSLVNLVVQALLSIAALALGIAGIVSRSPRKVAAGIGTGLAIAGLVGVLSSAVYPLIFELFG
ncbi:MAG: hypothetical protein ABWY03_09385 [Microbacterium sp.]